MSRTTVACALLAATSVPAFAAANGAAAAIPGNAIRVHSIAELAAGIAANPDGSFALANDYDASADGTYVASPIPALFSGTFDGHGHTISNLSINDPTAKDDVGLFAELYEGATVRNLKLANVNVVGAGSEQWIGGLAGLQAEGLINHVSVTGTVSGGEYSWVGGLAGGAEGTVHACDADITVSTNASNSAGGLVGGNFGLLSNSTAEGNISGDAVNLGGFVGYNSADSRFFGKIRNSHSSASVTQLKKGVSGGLVGDNGGTIEKSFSSGTVVCQSVCGGLAGANASGEISRSYATGNVSGSGAGGLVGQNEGIITNSYATGETSGYSVAGGLVGLNSQSQVHQTILKSYSSGLVNGDAAEPGGLIGSEDIGGDLQHDYWDTTTSGITNKSQGAGNVSNEPGIKGLSNAKLQAKLPQGFDPKIWGQDPAINGGLPYLLALPPG
ncbi:MAG TPA: GLUG motif-containing protein [Rhizomicrobium sp.]